MRDGFVQAVQVLHIDGRPDIDTGRLQFLDVLPALRVPAARRIGVGQLVDQHQRGATRQRTIEIELAEHAIAIRHIPHRQAVDALDQCLGLGAAMRFDHADDHVNALLAQHRAAVSIAKVLPTPAEAPK